MKVLHILSNFEDKESSTHMLSHDIVEKLKKSFSEIDLKELTVNDFSHVKKYCNAVDVQQPENQKKEVLKISDEIVRQLYWAEIIVIGLTLQNFDIPFSLKGWIDDIAREGIIFTFTHTGKLRLVCNKKIFIAISSGGTLTVTDHIILDHTENYLKTVFGFFSMTDVKVFRDEGLAIADVNDLALEKALNTVKSAL